MRISLSAKISLYSHKVRQNTGSEPLLRIHDQYVHQKKQKLLQN